MYFTSRIEVLIRVSLTGTFLVYSVYTNWIKLMLTCSLIVKEDIRWLLLFIGQSSVFFLSYS